MPDMTIDTVDNAAIQEVRRNLQHLMEGGSPAADVAFDEAKAESCYTLGHTQYLQGHYAEAMKFFGFILSRDPLHYRAMQAMAACMQMTGKYGQALLLLGILLVAKEDNKEISLQIIHCLIHLGRHSEALKIMGAVEAALVSDPDNLSAQQRIDGYRLLAQQGLAIS